MTVAELHAAVPLRLFRPSCHSASSFLLPFIHPCSSIYSMAFHMTSLVPRSKYTNNFTTPRNAIYMSAAQLEA
ncbi:hypothetical protein ARMGADRAFT_1014262 [Armillaria gallica]|uniref:Uncharacterized protein n=1 Tax=Armillaria gallica TaxID=47427 RepID=A0A2H3DU70_ARMGA|nr:hypothetical protein ARMGADRAFT_1014262 [Armillaria gallica]